MKLRIKGNSLRLRLTQGEVDRLRSAGRVEETVDFGNGGASFGYSLEISEDATTVSADLIGGCIRVLVPQDQARTWYGSDDIGIASVQNGLSILVEKDLACVKPRPGEDESDMFPNPAISC